MIEARPHPCTGMSTDVNYLTPIAHHHEDNNAEYWASIWLYAALEVGQLRDSSIKCHFYICQL